MKQILARAALALLAMVLCAPIFPVGALALSGSDALLYADLNRAGFEFEYVPQANSRYALYLFSADGGNVHARAQILENGAEIASGEGRGEICSAWLVAGVRYVVRVQGSGSAVIEMARCALSRSFSMPLSLTENDPYEKMIAHAYDAHWYAFEAAGDGPAMITCVPEDELILSALLFDAGGTRIGEFESLSGGAAMMRHSLKAGEQYYLRISAPSGGEGYYSVMVNRPEADLPDAPAFDSASVVLAAGSRAHLGQETGSAALLWTSDDPSIARVDQTGTVLGVRSGETMITAYGLQGSAQCRLRVEYVPLEGLNLLGEGITLSAGDDADIQLEIFPENASDRRVDFHVADPSIASVSRSGVLRGLQSGETMLTVTNADGSISDSIPVTVHAAQRRYRALLVGEENYPFADDSRREGSENSVSAIKSMLGAVEFENAAYSVRVGRDMGRSELISAIRETFMSATARDVSLLYITCHGSYSGGMSFLELSDGSVLSVRDLERELRGISGTVVVMIDSCGSGGSIGAYSDRIAFARGVTGAFAGAGIRGGKYKVIASAALDQDSYRIALNEDAAQGMMATVFSRALCDGAGWDMDRGQRSTMGADFDYDGGVTLAELQIYMQERVAWYMDIVSDLTGEDYRQSVQVYPEGDPLVLFERK